MKEKKSFDMICLGRAGVDLYSVESNVDFLDVKHFRKSVGGSPANIAVALSTLGANVGFIGKVSDDPFGHYVKSFLERKGVNTDGLLFDHSGSKTSLAITEMKPENCGVLFYRERPSDLELTPSDIKESYILSSKGILLSGTALSRTPSREASFKALDIAKGKIKVVFDIDYRLSAWNNVEETVSMYREASFKSDIIIGNTQEISLLGKKGIEETIEELIGKGIEMIIHKKAEGGSDLYTKEGLVIKTKAFQVDAKKPFGAGDAFAGAFLWRMMKDHPLEECLQWGNAAGAFNVMGDTCSESMPTEKELKKFITDFGD